MHQLSSELVDTGNVWIFPLTESSLIEFKILVRSAEGVYVLQVAVAAGKDLSAGDEGIAVWSLH